MPEILVMLITVDVHLVLEDGLDRLPFSRRGRKDMVVKKTECTFRRKSESHAYTTVSADPDGCEGKQGQN